MMEKSVALPTIDGRSCIPDQMIAELPHLMDMIGRQSNYWRYDPDLAAYLAPEMENSDGRSSRL